MNKFELIKAFEELFPSWTNKVYNYKKIGPNLLVVEFTGYNTANHPVSYSRIFLYKGKDDWCFGTKLYRKRPSNYKSNKNIKNKEK